MGRRRCGGGGGLVVAGRLLDLPQQPESPGPTTTIPQVVSVPACRWRPRSRRRCGGRSACSTRRSPTPTAAGPLVAPHHPACRPRLLGLQLDGTDFSEVLVVELD
jgi:hypothetical protein